MHVLLRRIPVSLSDKIKSTKIAIGNLPEYSVGKGIYDADLPV